MDNKTKLMGIFIGLLTIIYVVVMELKRKELIYEYKRQEYEDLGLEYLFYIDSLKKEGVYYPEEFDTIPDYGCDTVRITQYNPVESQTDSDPLITADLSEINMVELHQGKTKWVAVSRDLLKKYGYGTKIRIQTGDPEIDGIYEVHDTMNKRWTAKVDILTPPGKNLSKGIWTGNIRLHVD